MHVVTGRNVNAVYHDAVALVRSRGEAQSSRAGPVLAVPEPVVLETLYPRERVLLDPVRNQNPFFVFFESLHMLAGRRDYTFLDRFVRDFSSRFAEEDGDGWGAYGHRWRRHFDNPRSFSGPIDQLDYTVEALRRDPLDRRVVITMWNPSVDLGTPARDLPCNTHIYPRIVDGRLDLMVCCRSNDVVWGATGANAVHFAFLQEYLAGRIGVQVGTLRQMTTNLHGYVDVLDKVGEPTHLDPYDDLHDRLGSSDGQYTVCSAPIGTDWEHWDEDLLQFLSVVEKHDWDPAQYKFRNEWFTRTAVPMWYSHAYWRLGHPPSTYLTIAEQIQAPDWRLAATCWLRRRKSRVAE